VGAKKNRTYRITKVFPFNFPFITAQSYANSSTNRIICLVIYELRCCFARLSGAKHKLNIVISDQDKMHQA
jgi:hypothetical protein